MKTRISLTLMVMALFLARAAKSQDTLFIDNMIPRNYYCGEDWWDYWYLNFETKHPWGNCEHKSRIAFTYLPSTPVCAREDTRFIRVTDSLRIVGVAIVAEKTYYSNSLDYDFLPDYLSIYNHQNGEMVKLASARWDTASARYYMPVEMYPYYSYNYITQSTTGVWKPYYRPVYEAFFETPVTVADSFYVSVTNNGYYDTIISDNTKIKAHGIRLYYHTKNNFPDDTGGSNVLHSMLKNHHVDDANQAGYFNDTLWHMWPFDANMSVDSTKRGAYFNIFPIIDTNYFVDVNDPNECLVPSNFRVNTFFGGVATFYWDGSASEWELSYGSDIASPDEGTVVNIDHAFFSLSNLDTARRYTAWVRALCDSANVSQWSDSIVFYIPSNNGGSGDTNDTGVLTVSDLLTSITPNPANEKIVITSSLRMNGVEIYTISGTLVWSMECNARETEVDISSLPSGTYIVRIATSRGYAIKKLSVK